MTRSAKSELVDFVVHRAFYPVLMAQRTGPHKARVERAQEAARTEIERFRRCKSAEDVVATFWRDLRPGPASRIHSELRSLNLPVISDLREGFEQKARELGVAPGASPA